jgi:hypothetical protein
MEMKYMKKKLTLLFAIIIQFIFQASCFSAPTEIKCVQNPIIPTDSSIIYCNSSTLVAYAKNSNKYTVMDIAHGVKTTQYTIPINEQQVGNDGQYMLLRTGANNAYTYFSLDMLTGKQIMLITTDIYLRNNDYILANSGKVLISHISRLVANGEIGKSMSDVLFAKDVGLGYGTPKKYPNFIYIWKNDSLALLNISSMKVITVFNKAIDNSLAWIPINPPVNMPIGFTDEYSVLNESTKEVYLPSNQKTIVLTGIPTNNIVTSSFNSAKNKIALLSSDNVLYIYDILSKTIQQTIHLNKNINCNKIFWSYDDTTVMLSNENVMTDACDSNIYAIRNGKAISICPGLCTDLMLTKQGISFTLGTVKGSEGWMEYVASATYDVKTGRLNESLFHTPSPDAPKVGVVLQKSNDFSITTNSHGIPTIKSTKGWKIIDSDTAQSSNYWFIANSNVTGFYIYNASTNKLYHANYKITTELDFRILNNGKFALVRAKTKAGTQYFNVFTLQ